MRITLLHISLYLSALLLITSCSDKEMDPPPADSQTLIIGHRASGSGVKGGFIENTLPAVAAALNYADGVEVDIQMSKDNTLWIYHDDLFNYNCIDDTLPDVSGNCILNLPDSVISSVRICREGEMDRIYRLSELFDLYISFPDKYVSLDIKGYFNSSCIPTNNVSTIYLDSVAEQLFQLLEFYNMTKSTFIETNYTYLFDRLKEKNSKIKCHLLGYDNLTHKTEQCIQNNWQGISFNMYDSSLTSQNVNALKNAKLELQLWTVYSENDLRAALHFKPTAIQVSDISLMETIHEMGIQSFY